MKEIGTHIFENLSILSQERESVISPYPSLSEVIARRTTPGILIFTFQHDLVYINAEAGQMLRSAGANGGGSSRRSSATYIPEVVTNLCNQLKQLVTSPNQRPDTTRLGYSQTPSLPALSTTGARPCSLRAFFLSNSQNGTSEDAYILILIERISPSKKLDLNRTAKQYRLSRREVEVVRLFSKPAAWIRPTDSRRPSLSRRLRLPWRWMR